MLLVCTVPMKCVENYADNSLEQIIRKCATPSGGRVISGVGLRCLTMTNRLGPRRIDRRAHLKRELAKLAGNETRTTSRSRGLSLRRAGSSAPASCLPSRARLWRLHGDDDVLARAGLADRMAGGCCVICTECRASLLRFASAFIGDQYLLHALKLELES